ncbi:MAG: hypothetical protein H6555_00990 [Lewinellaceae bacterium]|nr:hypothetical protein [Lewinellaceae bacterium]
MNRNKLIQLLAAFSETEMARFWDFVRSPYFNQQEILIRLTEFLRNSYPDFPAGDLDRKVLFAFLFPGEAYSYARLSQVQHQLLSLAEQFLAQQYLENEPGGLGVFTLWEYAKRRLEKHYSFLYNKIIGQWKKQDQHPSIYHKRILLNETGNYFYALRGVHRYDVHLQLVAEALDDYYFLQRLRFSAEMANRQRISQGVYIDLLPKLLPGLIERPKNPPLVELFLAIYLLFTSEQEEQEAQFNKVLELLRAHSGGMDKELMRDIYSATINYCARKIRAGNNHYHYSGIALELYIQGLDMGVYFNNRGFLAHQTFSNIFRLGIILYRYDWCQQFIANYGERITPENRSDTLNYNLALLHFQLANYDKVLVYLRDLQYFDLAYQLGARSILLKTYFELKETEPCLALIAAFTMYLRRDKKFATNQKRPYERFCQTLYKMVIGGPAKYEKIRQQVAKMREISERPWLNQVLASG